jgi:hypothetical protein
MGKLLSSDIGIQICVEPTGTFTKIDNKNITINAINSVIQ